MAPACTCGLCSTGIFGCGQAQVKRCKPPAAQAARKGPGETKPLDSGAAQPRKWRVRVCRGISFALRDAQVARQWRPASSITKGRHAGPRGLRSCAFKKNRLVRNWNVGRPFHPQLVPMHVGQLECRQRGPKMRTRSRFAPRRRRVNAAHASVSNRPARPSCPLPKLAGVGCSRGSSVLELSSYFPPWE